VGGDGRFVEGTPLFAGQKVDEANRRSSRLLQRARPRCCTTRITAQLSALLAPQDAGDLPRHAAVVHQHGPAGLRANALRDIKQVSGRRTGASSASPA
jgi:hypothetical protein